MNILVTGSNGFIGKNLVAWLQRREDVRVLGFDVENTPQELEERLAAADLVYHLAGVNRPQSPEEFRTGNVDLTAQLCEILLRQDRPVPVVLASSIQAELDNPYGVSKRQAEEVIIRYGQRGGRGLIFRLSNVFGKWCRPNYNSVVATFCYNIARDLPITISDPTREVPLVHVDDVVRGLLQVAEEVVAQNDERRTMNAEHRGQEIPELRGPAAGSAHSGQSAVEDSEIQERHETSADHHSPFTIHHSPFPFPLPPSVSYHHTTPIYTVTLGRLAELIRSFRESRRTLLLPDFGDPFIHKLYGTFLSYLEPDDFAYDLTQRSDPRGALAEFVKSEPFGQVFVSRTKPGITRGNHFHHTKTEKFLVLEGEAVIRFRWVGGHEVPKRSEVEKAEKGAWKAEDRAEVIEYQVSGRDFRVVDIPPGYTHSIENIGDGELVTLFWASEVFDPERPDTVWEEV